jgi:hypothetical protein
MNTSEAFPDIRFENESAMIFADYWASLPRIDLVPARNSFEPEDVSPLLPTFQIHEMRGPGRIDVRLSGTALTDRYSFDMTGKSYLDAVHPKRRKKVWWALWHIVAKPCGMVVYIQSVRESGMI